MLCSAIEEVVAELGVATVVFPPRSEYRARLVQMHGAEEGILMTSRAKLPPPARER